MCGHIIRSLTAVSIQFPLLILRRESVKRVGHVGADILIPIFVEREGAGGVLDEEVEEADFVGFHLGEFLEDGIGDEVGAAALGGEGEGLLGPGHCCFCWLCCARCGRTAGASREFGWDWRGKVWCEKGKRVCQRDEQVLEKTGEEGDDEDAEENAGVAKIGVERHWCLRLEEGDVN